MYAALPTELSSPLAAPVGTDPTPMVSKTIVLPLYYGAILGAYNSSHSSSEYLFISDAFRGKLYPSHHLRIALSDTPNCAAILVNGVERIRSFSSSLEGLSHTLCDLFTQSQHNPLFELDVISLPHSEQ